MSTTTQSMTADELLKLPRGRWRYELVRGELRTMSPAGDEHGLVIMKLGVPLGHHVQTNNIGVVYGAETGFRIATDPDTVRAPDIAFISRERFEQTGVYKGYRPGAPDLAVEVLSPGDTAEEVEEKVAEWLAAGARAVWVLSPKRRTVTVHRSPKDIKILTEQDELDGADVVPGFRCRVADIFV